MRRGIVGGVALGAVIGACFSTPHSPGTIDGPPGADDGGMADAEVVISPDGNADLCKIDVFLGTGSGSCGAMNWGELVVGATGMAWLSGTTTGELVLGLQPGISSAQCSSTLHAAWNRVTVDVKQLEVTTNAETAFVGLASDDNTQEWGVAFEYDDVYSRITMSMACSGGAAAETAAGADRAIVRGTWNPTAQRYLQVERTSDTALTFRASPDNVMFTQVGTCTLLDGTPFLTSQVRLRMQRPVSGGGSQAAQFGHIEMCRDP